MNILAHFELNPSKNKLTGILFSKYETKCRENVVLNQVQNPWVSLANP
jgi:hypothetical protein